MNREDFRNSFKLNSQERISEECLMTTQITKQTKKSDSSLKKFVAISFNHEKFASRIFEVGCVASLTIVPVLMSGCAGSWGNKGSPEYSQSESSEPQYSESSEADAIQTSLNTETMESSELSQKEKGFTLADDSFKGMSISLKQTGTSGDTVEVSGISTKPKMLTLTNPNRLIIDFDEKFSIKRGELPPSTSTVAGIRTGAQKEGTRVVFDLKNEFNRSALESNSTFANGKLTIKLPDMNEEFASTITKLPELKDSTSKSSSLSEDSLTTSQAVPLTTKTAALESIQLIKSEQSSGQVAIQLSSPRQFELMQSAPTEYALTIMNAVVSDESKLPQIAAMGTPGVRSARAVQQGNDAIGRMFVDAGIELQAKKSGNQILIQAETTTLSSALSKGARAQLATPEGASEGKKETDDDVARKNPTGVPSANGDKIYTGRLISLDLQETDIDNALRIIA